MKRQEITIQSHFDNLTLHGLLIEPNETPLGVVQIQHGMCEYKERYEEFMCFLAENGYAAVCYDQRGHGDSVKTAEDWGWFGDREAKAFIDDAVQMTEDIKQRYPDLPVTLIGHSMGSMIVRCYIQEHDDLIDKLIVSGSPSKNPFAGLGIGLAKLVRLFKGDRYRSKLLAYLATGKGDKLFPGEAQGAWLSKNYECTESFYKNPKGAYKFTCNGFENLFKLMKRTYTKSGYKVKNPNLPIKFLSGEKDAVLMGEGKFGQTIDFMYRVGYTNVTGKLYKGLRHEILNEIGREEVYEDVLAFLSE